MEDRLDYYDVDSPPYKYFLCITTKFSYRTGKAISHNINLGGRMKGCVQIVVEEKTETDPRFKVLEDEKDTAHISWIGFNQKCSLGHDLASGLGTRHIIKTAMTIVIQEYDWIKQFSLVDASQIKCREGMTVSLLHLSLSLYGKTYYERYLHAQLEDPGMRAYYIAGKAILNDTVLPWNTICDCIHDKSKQNYIEGIYDSEMTNLAFFQAIRDKDVKVYCHNTWDWLERIINYIFQTDKKNLWGQTWIIDIKNVKMIHTSIKTNSVNIAAAKTILQQEMFSVNGGSAYFGEGDMI